ncbi:MAG: hypothetical protein SNF33_04545 [Candidatus Algichlamydia australiensis]|nr:hypothetical protein [Chlamydiales bacterium]
MGADSILPEGVKPFDHLTNQLQFTNVDPEKPWLQTATPNEKIAEIFEQCVAAYPGRRLPGDLDEGSPMYILAHSEGENGLFYAVKPRINYAIKPFADPQERFHKDNHSLGLGEDLFETEVTTGKKKIFYNASSAPMIAIGGLLTVDKDELMRDLSNRRKFHLDKSAAPPLQAFLSSMVVTNANMVAAEILPKTVFQFSDPKGRTLVHTVFFPKSAEEKSAFLSIHSPPPPIRLSKTFEEVRKRTNGMFSGLLTMLHLMQYIGNRSSSLRPLLQGREITFVLKSDSGSQGLKAFSTEDADRRKAECKSRHHGSVDNTT